MDTTPQKDLVEKALLAIETAIWATLGITICVFSVCLCVY